jgi:hypothetical protein
MREKCPLSNKDSNLTEVYEGLEWPEGCSGCASIFDKTATVEVLNQELEQRILADPRAEVALDSVLLEARTIRARLMDITESRRKNIMFNDGSSAWILTSVKRGIVNCRQGQKQAPGLV